MALVKEPVFEFFLNQHFGVSKNLKEIPRCGQ
jgi:hypothetical protein